jgi:uncharacterized protein YdaU (DUF1376 family)
VSGDITVYDDERTHEDIAAVASREPEFAAAAAKIFAEVKAEAAQHVHTGRFLSKVTMHQEKVDWHIEIDDLDYDWNTEMGHYAGERGKPGRKWVKGIGVFRNVVRRHGGF